MSDESVFRVIQDDTGEVAMPLVRITIEDMATGETVIRAFPSGDYFLFVTGPAWVDRIQEYRTGTRVITIKGMPTR